MGSDNGRPSCRGCLEISGPGKLVTGHSLSTTMFFLCPLFSLPTAVPHFFWHDSEADRQAAGRMTLRDAQEP